MTNFAVHILYTCCAQHGVAGPCAHTEDEHVLMGLGGRVLTNTLAATRLLVAGYYGPCLALVRDNVETNMLLGVFEAAPEEVAMWRTMPDGPERWRRFKPATLKKRLGWHRYEEYSLYSKLAGHPTRITRLSFSVEKERRMVGPFVDAELATRTLQSLAIAAAHAAYQTVEVLKVTDRFAAEVKELNDALAVWVKAEESAPGLDT